MDLLLATRKALLANELSNNTAAAYRFSDAGGKSGLSFGITQLDVSHNLTAVKCLRECGFTEQEIAALKLKQGGGLSMKLAAHKEIVDKYDDAQVKECLDHVMTVAKSRRIQFANDAAIVHLADYHNQFYLENSGKMADALVALRRPVNALDILTIKITKTVWGMQEPEDVRRRYANIVKITAALKG